MWTRPPYWWWPPSSSARWRACHQHQTYRLLTQSHVWSFVNFWENENFERAQIEEKEDWTALRMIVTSFYWSFFGKFVFQFCVYEFAFEVVVSRQEGVTCLHCGQRCNIYLICSNVLLHHSMIIFCNMKKIARAKKPENVYFLNCGNLVNNRVQKKLRNIFALSYLL